MKGILLCMSLQSLDGRPKLAQLKFLPSTNGDKLSIINEVASKWEGIGVLMDFDDTGTQLELIRRSRGDRSPESCCLALFQYWLQGNGKGPHTWVTVIELLEDVGHRELARKLKTELKIN